MNFYEEAELGYRKAVEYGDYQLDTWLFWSDILQYLGEFENAILTLLQASEYFPEEYQVEYRLAGLHFMMQEAEKGVFHLSNGLRLNFQNHGMLKELFPSIWDKRVVQSCIAKYKRK